MDKQTYRHLITEITRLFVRSKEFKIFEITPSGWFVSLGLTTSLNTLEKLKDVFKNSDYDFKIADLAKMKSIRLEDGTYENVIEELGFKEKFDTNELPGCIILGEEAKEEYPEISEAIESSDGKWENHGILVSPDKEPVLFYKKVNYKKVDNLEFRLGIYVLPKDIN